jgi:glucose uptake protein
VSIWLVAGALDDGTWWRLGTVARGAPGGVVAALVAGGLFAVGSLLLLTAAETVGLAVAAAASGATALSVGVALGHVMAPAGPTALVAGSLALAVAAVAVSAMACVRRQRHAGAPWEKPFVVAVLSGAILASFPPFLARASTGAVALSPMAATAYLAAGTSVFGLAASCYLMARPLLGAPLHGRTLFDVSMSQYVKGVLGGLVWCAGVAATLTASPAAGALASYGMSLATPLVTSMWGVAVWREFRHAPWSGLGYLSLALALHFLSMLSLVTAYRPAS